MQNLSTSERAVKWTNENIIDLVRKIRNDLIKDFLDERFLKEYVAVNFNVKDLSHIKVEFIKARLKEHLISPVDAGHYAPLITQIREPDTASLTEGNEALFYREIERILKHTMY